MEAETSFPAPVRRRRRAAIRSVALALLLTMPGGVALGHDIWLHAEPFVPAVGETLVVRQLVGDELDTDMTRSEETTELPVLRDMTPRFELITAAGSVDLLAQLPEVHVRPVVKPVLTRRMDASGLVLVVMAHDVLYTGHTDVEFLEYLGHEGLAVEDYRPHMGTDGFQDEGYVRTLKALVSVGEPAEDGAAGDLPGRATGQSFELLLLGNPYELDPGDPLEVRALLHGEPLAGLLVKAFNAGPGGAVASQSVRTDDGGRARFTLDRPGLWLIRAVHLAPCSERSAIDCSDTEWESYWASYSFELD